MIVRWGLDSYPDLLAELGVGSGLDSGLATLLRRAKHSRHRQPLRPVVPGGLGLTGDCDSMGNTS